MVERSQSVSKQRQLKHRETQIVLENMPNYIVYKRHALNLMMQKDTKRCQRLF